MTIASADFRGIVAINKEMIEKLRAFLKEREEYTVQLILEACDQLFLALGAATDSFDSHNLAEMVARLKRRVDLADFASTVDQGRIDQHLLVLQERINAALWGYLELLEGGATELFHQLDLEPIETWDYQFSKVLEALVELINEPMQRYIGIVDQLEKLLWQLRDRSRGKGVGFSWIGRLARFSRFLLDKELIPTARKSKRFLMVRYRGWHDRFQHYIQFNTRAAESLKKLEQYRILHQQPVESQETFQAIYRLLKIWEIDAKSKAILLHDLQRSLRRQVSAEQALDLYQQYYLDIRSTLFQASRRIKEVEDCQDSTRYPTTSLIADMQSARRELNTLGRLLARFREFLLRTDPNPYVRSRWGFAEWVVGPEPEACKALLRLELKTEGLDLLFGQFIGSLEAPHPVETGTMDSGTYSELQKILHAMAQPLNSRHVMVSQGERFTDVLHRFNELGSTSPEAMDLVGEVMARALRSDSKHHVLHENQKFIELYRIHRELVRPELEQPPFQSMREQTQEAMRRIVKWTERGTIEKHRLEVDRLYEELTQYLQKKLTEELVQSQKGPQLNRLRQQIVDLRYLLGDFYHRLHQASSDGVLVKAQFRDVDLILDSLDNRFGELGYTPLL